MRLYVHSWCILCNLSLLYNIYIYYSCYIFSVTLQTFIARLITQAYLVIFDNGGGNLERDFRGYLRRCSNWRVCFLWWRVCSKLIVEEKCLMT